MIDSVLMILEPIQNFEKKLQQECLPTISLVYGGIHAIMQLFDNLTRQSILPGVCGQLREEFSKRFDDVLQSGKVGSDPIYVAAAALDPVVAQNTSILDEQLDLCRQAIKEMGKLIIDEYDGASVVVEEVSCTTSKDVFGFDMPVKKKKRLIPAAEEDKLEIEMDEYRFTLQQPLKTGAIEFWNSYDGKLAYMARIARSVLAVPAASSSVERLFSQLTLSSSGHKGRSGSQAIRRKSLLAFNDQFIRV